jgi:hypothetical protein
VVEVEGRRLEAAGGAEGISGRRGGSDSPQAFESDRAGTAGVLVNMSVWESVEALDRVLAVIREQAKRVSRD